MGPVMSHVTRALVLSVHRLSWHRKALQHRLFGTRRRATAEVDQGASEDLWLLVGLGNPGSRYTSTRHNVGFQLLDELARREGIKIDKLQKKAAVGKGRLYGKRVVLAKPMTFMNVSGESVSALLHFYKSETRSHATGFPCSRCSVLLTGCDLSPAPSAAAPASAKVPMEQVLIVYDDLDLDVGAVRLRAKGGAGGHNGMRSIQQRLGGNSNIPRLKIGIGRPTTAQPIASYVLEAFSSSEKRAVEGAIDEGIRAIEALLSLGWEKALSGVRI